MFDEAFRTLFMSKPAKLSHKNNSLIIHHDTEVSIPLRDIHTVIIDTPQITLTASLMEEKFMRVLVMFDMPTKTKQDRKASTKFRSMLLKEGYFMLQFSVYVRICKGIKSANTYLERLHLYLPKKGHIRALILTEKQFDHMRILIGEYSEVEKARKPTQLTLF